MKKITSKQVLEIIASLVSETLPPDTKGQLHLQYDEDNNVEVYFLESNTAEA